MRDNYIAVETLLGKQTTLATQMRSINKRIAETDCHKCRLPLEVKRKQIADTLDKVNGVMHEFVRKLNRGKRSLN